MDGRWFGGGIHAGSLADQFFINPGNFLYFLERIILHDSFFEGIPAVYVILHKVLFIEFFFNNDVVEAEGQGAVCSRAELKPEVGLAGIQ